MEMSISIYMCVCVCLYAKMFGCAKAIISTTDSKARAISYRNTLQSLNKLPCRERRRDTHNTLIQIFININRKWEEESNEGGEGGGERKKQICNKMDKFQIGIDVDNSIHFAEQVIRFHSV